MPDVPDDPDGHADDQDVDGSDWLLEQLSGGRRARREAERAREREAAEARAAQAQAEKAQAEEAQAEEPARPATESADEPTTPPESPFAAPLPAAPAPAAPLPAAPLSPPLSAADSEATRSWSIFDEQPDTPEPDDTSAEADAGDSAADGSAADAADDALDDLEDSGPAFVWGLKPGEDPSKFSHPADAALPEAPLGVVSADAPQTDIEPQPKPEPEPTREPEPPAEADEPEPAVAQPQPPEQPESAIAEPDLPVLPVFGAPVLIPPAFPTMPHEPAIPPAAVLAPSESMDAEHEGTAEPAAFVPTSASPAPAEGAEDGGSGQSTAGAPPKTPRGRRPGRIWFWIGGIVVLLLVLAGLFYVGTMIAGTPAPASSTSTSTSQTASETPVPEVTGPAALGEQKWDALGGGECLEPFTSPWAETFTVVDCATPHASQLVYRGSFGGEAAAPFPGEAALAAQINALCSARGIIDLDAAAGYQDLQVQGSYPVTEAQWTDTGRYYYCFVTRSSGEKLAASIAGPGPTA